MTVMTMILMFLLLLALITMTMMNDRDVTQMVTKTEEDGGEMVRVALTWWRSSGRGRTREGVCVCAHV